MRYPWAAAGPGRTTSRRAEHTSATQRRRCGGRRRVRRARLRCPRAAGPSQATHRHPDRLEAAARPAGPGRGAGGRRQGLAGLREDTPSQSSAHPAPLVWRTPEGTATVPVGGGRAQPGFKIDHSKPALRIVGCGGGVRSVPGVVDSVVGRRPNTGVRLGCLINQNSHVIWVP